MKMSRKGYVRSFWSRRAASMSFFAYWNCRAYGSPRSADFTQKAERRTKCRAPAARAASRQFRVAW